MTVKQSLSALYYLLISTAITSTLAVLEHFKIFATCGLMGLGYFESCWVQDVQSRVFSTLGQPNWLAALVVILLPISWLYSFKNKWYILLSVLFFVTLLFTKSRSGLLAFGIEFVIFFTLMFWKEKSKIVKEFLILLFTFIVIYFAINPPHITNNPLETTSVGPALEVGGTESGTIRKYVWTGAINIFKNYPLLGSGPETFAYTFPKHKPIEHNLTSEWDFIYNKAHNEYLNYLANTGILGLISYLVLIIVSTVVIYKSKNIALLAGYFSILATNFFGFSVVAVSLLFFIFPAMAIVTSSPEAVQRKKQKLNTSQMILTAFVVIAITFSLYFILGYWRSDVHYNSARNYNREKNRELALVEITKALKYTPNEPLYMAEKALANLSINDAVVALDANPYNQNVRNILISNLSLLASQNKEYLLVAEEIALTGSQIAPTNPKSFYQLGILNLKNGKLDEGLENLERAVILKPNYKEGRFALGLTYIDIQDYENAKEHLEYILNNIDPNDELIKKYLDQSISASK